MRQGRTVRGFHVDVAPIDPRGPPTEVPRDVASGVRTPFDAIAAVTSRPMGQCGRCESIADDASGPCPACGAPLAAFVVDGRYVVEAEIGRGGMGVVYRARDVSLERDVAIKLVVPWGVDVPDLERRLRNEAAALAAVRSANVVSVYSFGAYGESWFFAMELVRGRGLFDILTEEPLLPIPRVLTIGKQMAAGLGALHSVGIIHRDVKPSNVIIENKTERVVLIDLGIARRLAPAAGSTTRAIGTPAYMAPEQVSQTTGARITARSDIYGLACTMFELLTGQLPFERTEDPVELAYRHVHEAPPRPSSIRPELAPLDAVFARGLAKDPAQRPATAEDLAAELESSWARSATSPTSQRPRAMRVLVIGRDDEARELARSAAQLTFTGTRLRMTVADRGEGESTAAMVQPDLVVIATDPDGDESVPADGLGAHTFIVDPKSSHDLAAIVSSLRVQATAWGLLAADRRPSRPPRPSSK